ncbi:PIG-P-domain-containing protein [Hyaloraphidium curvatum]|nr:PIG-P-domain-containing protein [Hyaloraphidium curvatum]
MDSKDAETIEGSEEGDREGRDEESIVQYYGFAVYLATYLCFGLYIAWAYLPEHVLESMGITYYPNRWWALAVPSWLIMLIPFILVMFTGMNLARTLPLDSVYTITDDHAVLMSREEVLYPTYQDPDFHPELQDIPLGVVNQILYGNPDEDGQ